jgi:hypothetical protein
MKETEKTEEIKKDNSSDDSDDERTYQRNKKITFLQRPQLISVIKKPPPPVVGFRKINVDMDMLNRYHRIIDQVAEDRAKGKRSNYIIRDHEKGDYELSEIEASIDLDDYTEKIFCSNCREYLKIAITFYAPDYSIHFCKDCKKVYAFPFTDFDSKN